VRTAIVVGYFFIGGAPKSGNTWLQRTLDLHPQIVCSGEGHLHECVMRPVAEMVAKYNVKLSGVADIVYEGRPYNPPVSFGEHLRITRAVVAILMERRAKPGARLFGDKTPANIHIVEDLAKLFPTMKAISMLRDPRDVAASRLGHASRTGHPDAEDRSSDLYRELVKAAATDWRVAVERTRAFAEKQPDRIIVVRYEDLLRDRPGELKRILDFLEVETSAWEMAEILAGSSFEAFSGGRIAGVERRDSFYRKGVPGDWPNHLSDEALQILAAECGPAIGQAGYAIDPVVTAVPARRAFPR
jgi:hypothetical protein